MPPEELIPVIRDAVRQHDLITAERSLIEQTLMGTVKILTEVMSLTTPIAFRRSSVLKSYVKHMSNDLKVESSWDLELAATLAQVGYITLPPSTLEKFEVNQELDEKELEILNGHPAIGQRLLGNIPRLERVAKIVGKQATPDAWPETIDESDDECMINLGANMLRVGYAFDEQILNGLSIKQACEKLKEDDSLNNQLVTAMESFQPKYSQELKCALKVRELQPMMVLDADVLTATGQPILVEGIELTAPIIERLYNFTSGVGIEEPIRVRLRH